VARFLAVLDLYREEKVALEQAGPLAELSIRLIRPDEPRPYEPLPQPTSESTGEPSAEQTDEPGEDPR
jgi:chromatin segregation and condensation protein Rec8/ScpA/Scc1 (kleisin family)